MKNIDFRFVLCFIAFCALPMALMYNKFKQRIQPKVSAVRFLLFYVVVFLSALSFYYLSMFVYFRFFFKK
jgi:hypothetical protein